MSPTARSQPRRMWRERGREREVNAAVRVETGSRWMVLLAIAKEKLQEESKPAARRGEGRGERQEGEGEREPWWRE